MGAWADVLPLLALALLGSAHCVGMCGGFAVAVTADEPGTWARLLSRQGLYILGKASAYAVLALLLATGLAWLAGSDAGATGPVPRPGLLLGQRALSVLAGSVLIATGSSHLARRRLFAGGPLRALIEAVTAPARRLLDGARSLPPRARAFGIGVLNGLLPCGLSWAAILMAAQHPPHIAALGALAFGVATAPALVTVGLGARLGARLAGPRVRRLAPVLLGLLMIAFGVMTVLRGTPAAGLHATHTGPGCCEQR